MDRDFQARFDSLVARVASFERSPIAEVAARLAVEKAADDDSLIRVASDSSASESSRLRACWLLPRMDIPRAADTLILLLNDPQERVRAEAAMGLGLLPSGPVVQSLLISLRRDPATEVRLAAIHALGILSRADAAPHLLALISDRREDEEVRADAAEALAHVSAPDVVEGLLAALDDPSALVRYSACYALGEQRDPRALPALREVAATDRGTTKYGPVATSAAQAVESIAQRDE